MINNYVWDQLLTKFKVCIKYKSSVANKLEWPEQFHYLISITIAKIMIEWVALLMLLNHTNPFLHIYVYIFIKHTAESFVCYLAKQKHVCKKL